MPKVLEGVVTCLKTKMKLRLELSIWQILRIDNMNHLRLVILALFWVSTSAAQDIKAYYSSTDAGDVVYFISKDRLMALPSVRMEIAGSVPNVKLPVSAEAAINTAAEVVRLEYKDWALVGFYRLTLRELELGGKTVFQYDVMVYARKNKADLSVLTIPVLMDGKSMAFCSDAEWEKRSSKVNPTSQP